MSKVLQRIEVSLRNLYIFNSSFGQQEGEEHKKILYYYPNDIELNTKIKDVGLCEAIIAFTGNFVSEDDCKALHTQKTTQVFYQPEEAFWMVLVLNVPKEIKLKDGIEVAEYRGSEVCDRIYHAVLRQWYYYFRFHCGTLKDMSSVLELNKVASRLQQFFDKYLATSKQLSHCDIMDLLHTIQYLSLDSALFLRAHNFNSILCTTFPIIEDCVMMHNDQVICGGKLGPGDLYSLHSYVVENVLSTNLNSSRSTTNNDNDIYQNGAFVKQEISEMGQSSKVYLSVDSQVKPYYLILYRALNITLCLLLDGHGETPKPELYDELHNYISPLLSCLARDIASELAKQSHSTQAVDGVTTEHAPKYLFINELNLKHHTNIYRSVKGTQCIPRNIMSIIADLSNASGNDNVAGLVAATEEVQVKTTNDFWIVKRRCNWRQYYVVLSSSKATLLVASQEAKRIFEEELTDDVFFDK